MLLVALANIFSEHPVTVVLALIALIVWTLGNYLKKKWMIGIGIGLTIVALLTFTGVFDFVTQL